MNILNNSHSNVINIWKSVSRNEEIKVKQSRNRPGVAQRVPGGLDSQIFMTFGT
jgi:hypothetical protein